MQGDTTVLHNVFCVVVNYNDYQTCIEFIKSTHNNKSIKGVLIVDNNSTDGSYEILKKQERNYTGLTVIKSDKNGGYGYGNNIGIRYCFQHYNPSHIIISNPDVKFDDTIECLCKELDKDPHALIAAPKMVQKDGSDGNMPWRIPSKRQYVFLSSIFFSDNSFRHSVDDFKNKVEYVDCVSGAFLMIKAVDDIVSGIYDENLFLYCEETLIGMKYRSIGYRTVFLPDSHYIHLGSESINKTFDSEIKKLSITLDSRYYVLKKYYHIGLCERPIIKMIFGIQIMEWKLYLHIRNYLPWKRKK